MASGSQRSGSGYGGTTIRYDWSSTPNYAGNYSTVSVNLVLELRNGTSVVASENGNINIDGQISGYSRGSTSRGPNGDHLLHTFTTNVGHNNDGSKVIFIGGSYTSGFSSMGSFSTGQNWGLDNIPRYANFTSYGADQVNDQGYRIYCTMDATCNFFQYSLEDGVGWRDQDASTTTAYSVVLNNRPSGVTQNLRVRVRRADSGLWTESPVFQVTTNSQNNFMDFFDAI